MTVIRRFVDSFMSIVKGRALTPEDSESGRAVCVISRELSEEYGLDVGDSLPLKLGTVFFEQYKGLGAVAGTRERYSPAETDVELEIVGIYADTDPIRNQFDTRNWSYSINTVFVPTSLLPVSGETLESHEFTPSELSIVVSAGSIIPSWKRQPRKSRKWAIG